MKNGCAVVAAATLIAGLGLAPTTVEAGCNVRNPTACTADSKPQAAAAQPQAQVPQAQVPQAQASQPQSEAAAKPLQLKRYIKLGPARRAVSRKGKRRKARRSADRKPSAGSRRKTARTSRKAPPKVSATATASAEAGAAPLTPKAVPTVSISARALALNPATDDRTVGFAAKTTPWSGEGAFAYANEAETETLPPGVTIARFDEINDIDRAADMTSASVPIAKSDSLTTASLVTPANAAPSVQTADPRQPSSWLSWLYGKAADGLIAAATAIRSLFG